MWECIACGIILSGLRLRSRAAFLSLLFLSTGSRRTFSASPLALVIARVWCFVFFMF